MLTRRKLACMHGRMQLIDRIDTNRDGKVSPDEFLELTCKVMEGLSETAKQKGVKAMRSAAEGLRPLTAPQEAWARDGRNATTELVDQLSEENSKLRRRLAESESEREALLDEAGIV